MTTHTRAEMHRDDSRRSAMPPLAQSEDQSVLAWLLDPSSGQLIQCRTMAHTGRSTAKLFG